MLYANDTILFIKHDMDKAQNPCLFLLTFEQMFGLKINFHKSELFFFGEAVEAATDYANLFRYTHGQFPIKYLGISIHYQRFTIA